MYFEKSAGDFLKEILEKNDVTSNKKAAQILGYTGATLSKTLNDDSYVTQNFLDKFFEKFEVDPVTQHEIVIRYEFANISQYWKNEFVVQKERLELLENERKELILMQKLIAYAKDIGLEKILRD